MNKKRSTLFYHALALLLACSLSFTVGDFTDARAAVITAQAKQVAKIVNQKRVKKGLKKLTLDKTLTKAANKRAKECAKLFSHSRPDGSSCFTVLGDYDISYTTCGENIAAGQPDAKSVMNSWMHSEGHKKNILTKGFKRIGVGYYKKKNSSYQYYWVQIFTD